MMAIKSGDGDGGTERERVWANGNISRNDSPGSSTEASSVSPNPSSSSPSSSSCILSTLS